MESDTEVLDVKSLATRLRRHPSFVYAMKRKGFRMVVGRTTFGHAWKWLEIHGSPRRGESRKKTEDAGQSRK